MIVAILSFYLVVEIVSGKVTFFHKTEEINLRFPVTIFEKGVTLHFYFSETDSSSDTYKVSLRLWNPNFHFLKSPPLDPNLSQMNSAHTLKHYFS
jgi:hypothetical protein